MADSLLSYRTGIDFSAEVFPPLVVRYTGINAVLSLNLLEEKSPRHKNHTQLYSYGNLAIVEL